jgi:hypothetical protein
MRLRAVLANVLRACGVISRPKPIQRTLGPLCVGAGLISRGFQLGNTVLQHRVREISNAVLDRVVEPLELGVRFGRALAQGGDMCGSALLAAVEHR